MTESQVACAFSLARSSQDIQNGAHCFFQQTTTDRSKLPSRLMQILMERGGVLLLFLQCLFFRFRRGIPEHKEAIGFLCADITLLDQASTSSSYVCSHC